MPPTTLGDQELALLRHVAGTAVTVADVVETFGAPRGLARSTVLTMMERLRRKGHLRRKLVAGVYRYEASESSTDVLRGIVHRFVERTLGGSVSPFVAYLNESPALTDEELQELQQVVERLRGARAQKERR